MGSPNHAPAVAEEQPRGSGSKAGDSNVKVYVEPKTAGERFASLPPAVLGLGHKATDAATTGAKKETPKGGDFNFGMAL